MGGSQNWAAPTAGRIFCCPAKHCVRSVIQASDTHLLDLDTGRSYICDSKLGRPEVGYPEVVASVILRPDSSFYPTPLLDDHTLSRPKTYPARTNSILARDSSVRFVQKLRSGALPSTGTSNRNTTLESEPSSTTSATGALQRHGISSLHPQSLPTFTFFLSCSR